MSAYDPKHVSEVDIPRAVSGRVIDVGLGLMLKLFT